MPRITATKEQQQQRRPHSSSGLGRTPQPLLSSSRRAHQRGHRRSAAGRVMDATPAAVAATAAACNHSRHSRLPRSVSSLLSSGSSLLSRWSRTLASDASAGTELKRTVLYDDHVALGGKMVPFAGYALPLQYKDSLMNSHLHCRNAASVFDVSHMGQLRIWGEKRVEFIEKLVPGDIAALSPNQARLSVLTNEKGGIIDDCMITSKADHLYMVINAGCKEKDMQHLDRHLAEFNAANPSSPISIELFSSQWELLAFQGPQAAAVLQRLVPQSVVLSQLPFMFSANIELGGVQCVVSRCGYTGEDGFEIAVLANQTKRLFHALLAEQEVLPAGLGVRDSLRLEAGLSLYGHDLSEETTPVEANLSWLIGKRRREQGGYLGADVIGRQLKEGAARKRVGLSVLAGAPAREGAEVLDEEGKRVGVVTSGGFSPCLKKGIAMGYVDASKSKLGTRLQVSVRGKSNAAEVCKMPFVPSRYYKPA